MVVKKNLGVKWD